MEEELMMQIEALNPDVDDLTAKQLEVVDKFFADWDAYQARKETHWDVMDGI